MEAERKQLVTTLHGHELAKRLQELKAKNNAEANKRRIEKLAEKKRKQLTQVKK